MTQHQREFFENRFKQLYVEGWDKLLVELKEHGGEMLVPVPESPEMVQLLLDNGRGFNTANVKLQPGEPSDCHGNTLRYWAKHETLQVVRGYGLSDDGLWRQHSWLWDAANDQVVETTVPREKYFGVLLSDAQACSLSLQYLRESDLKQAGKRFFACVEQINDQLEKEGIASLLPDLRGFVTGSLTDGQENEPQQLLQDIPTLGMFGELKAFKSGQSNDGASNEATASAVTQQAGNLLYADRVAICRRWIYALYSASINAEITSKKQKISLTASSHPNSVTVRSIGAVLHLTNCGQQHGTPESTPVVIVSVYHNRGMISDDSALLSGIGAAISKAIGKPVHLKFMSNITQEHGRLLLECADLKSAWTLAEFILKENGYDEEIRCMHGSGRCAACGDSRDSQTA